MTVQHSSEARDALWSHPDLLPTSDDLDEPMDFVGRQGRGGERDAEGRDEFDRLTAGLSFEEPTTDAAPTDAAGTDGPDDGPAPSPEADPGTGPEPKPGV